MTSGKTASALRIWDKDILWADVSKDKWWADWESFNQ